MTATSAYDKPKTIEEAIAQQYPTADGWICESCINHLGGVSCKAGIFIGVAGANTANCIYSQAGVRCRHCGKVT